LPRDVDGYPVNLAFLQILSVNCADLDQLTLAGRLEVPHACDVENMVIELSNYLSLVKTERGGAISSDCLSRLVQRRVVSILSAQLIVEDGRENVLKWVFFIKHYLLLYHLDLSNQLLSGLLRK
jgi:hypothetical protein